MFVQYDTKCCDSEVLKTSREKPSANAQGYGFEKSSRFDNGVIQPHYSNIWSICCEIRQSSSVY